MDERDPDLARGLVANEEGQVDLTVAVEIAPLIEGVHSIIPLVLSPELSVERSQCPAWHVPVAIDCQRIPTLRRERSQELGQRCSGDDRANHVHRSYVAPPNGMRLSCGR